MINKSNKDDFKLTRSESITLAHIIEQFMKKENRINKNTDV